MTCVSVDLNGFLFDDETEDADGVVWSWNEFAGWFNGPPTRIVAAETEPEITLVNVARRVRRSMTLRGTAQLPGGQPLGELYWKAQRRLKAATQPLLIPELMIVTEPDITLQALVRLGDGEPYRFRPVGELAVLEFEIDLFAPDWRRYGDEHEVTITVSGTEDTVNMSNNGDAPSPPVVTITGPAVNPRIANLALDGDPTVRYEGTIGGGDSLVLDMGQRTAFLNGSDVRDTITTAAWWQMKPGNNPIRLRRDSGASTEEAEVVWRDAYT